MELIAMRNRKPLEVERLCFGPGHGKIDRFFEIQRSSLLTLDECLP